MKIWAVANQKGGVGKTTTVVSCAGLLAEAGRRVLVVDLDPQGSLSSWFGLDPEQLVRSSGDLFDPARMADRAALDAMRIDTATPGLALLPAAAGLAGVERDARGIPGAGLRLRQALALLAQDYDNVLVDTPSYLGVLLVNAVAASERLLMPVQTDFLAIKGLQRMAHVLALIARARGGELPCSVLPTLFDPASEVSKRALRVLLARFSTQLGDSVVPIDDVFRDATMRGVIPSSLAPHSRGVLAYRSLLEGLGELQSGQLAASG
jgi:chromosome partitioning protein